MKPWRCDPYLWIHLAGLATVPLWIDLCLLGLAAGNPTLPGMELGFIVALGALPVLVMQLWRPFYIFSLPGLALRPLALQDDQRRLLTQFRRWRVRLGALLVPIPLVWALAMLYPLAFLARDITPFGDWGRLGGVAIAALSFFMANLFLQVPVAVLQVLATPDRRFQNVVPYPVDRVAADFSWLGLPVSKILPNIAHPLADPQVYPQVQTERSHTAEPSLAETDRPVEAQDTRAMPEDLLELAVNLQHADTSAKVDDEAPALGETLAAPGHYPKSMESLPVALEEPELDIASSPMDRSTADVGSEPESSIHPVPGAMPQQLDHSNLLPRHHPEVDDLGEDTTVEDHAFSHASDSHVREDYPLPTSVNQTATADDRPRLPANSIAKNG